jgi:hypothetical protein
MLSLGGGPSLGPSLSGSQPNFEELVGFGGCSARAPVDRGVKLLYLGADVALRLSWGLLVSECGNF